MSKGNEDVEDCPELDEDYFEAIGKTQNFNFHQFVVAVFQKKCNNMNFF